jgi:predicted regulator of Ras-like GTPase activity (Roadblock/LC7/MglB family)
MSRKDDLNNALSSLQSSSADIEACAVVSEDGLVIASSLPRADGFEENHIAAMSAAMLSMASRTAEELSRGKIEQLFVKGENGYVIISHAGPHASLLALAAKQAKLGLVFLDMSRAAEEIRSILM